MSVLTDKFDVVIDGVHYAAPSKVPEQFEALVRDAITDAEVRRAAQLGMLLPGERLRIELRSTEANFSVASDFSITWNGERYASYADLPQSARDGLVSNATFPDLDEDGIPDFFQHPASDDPSTQREVFRQAMRQNRQAQAVAAARTEYFAPDFPGYEIATFQLTIDGVAYESLTEVPNHRRETAQRLIIEFLRRRVENGGEPLTASPIVRLTDSEVTTIPSSRVPEAAPTAPEMPLAIADKVAAISARTAAVEAELAELAPSPVEDSNASRIAVMVMLGLATVALALVVTIVVLISGS